MATRPEGPDTVRRALLVQHIESELARLSVPAPPGMPLMRRLARWRRRRYLTIALRWLARRPSSKAAGNWQALLHFGVPLTALVILVDLLFRRSTLDPVALRSHIVASAVILPLWAVGEASSAWQDGEDAVARVERELQLPARSPTSAPAS